MVDQGRYTTKHHPDHLEEFNQQQQQDKSPHEWRIGGHVLFFVFEMPYFN